MPEDRFTNYWQLSKLIETYNALPLLRTDERIDDFARIIDVRHALAHGRIIAKDENEPMTIVKFSPPSGGLVEVLFAKKMTDEWFKQQLTIVVCAAHKTARAAQRLKLWS